MENKPPTDDSNSLETLEDPTTKVESAPESAPEAPLAVAPVPGDDKPKQSKGPSTPLAQRIRGLFKRFNIYLLIFVLVLIVAGVVAIVGYINSRHTANVTTASSQTLDQKALEQLANTDTTVGNANSVLNVQSPAVFAGKVLVRDTLEVAGGLQIGGNLSLAGVTVAGSSNFGQVQVTKNLAVLGDTALQGQVSIQKGLSVNGNGVFNGSLSAGQITTSALQLNGDLSLTHHVTAGGANPGRTNGPSIGSGGTASVSGSDTSGSVSINTGSGAGTGCLITVNFAAKFNATPHVIITPVGSSAANLEYYVNRSTSNFSICAAGNVPSNASFGFDYLVLD